MSQPESPQRSQLPDLYRLLGLQPLESDLTRIQASVDGAVARAKRSRARDPELSKRALKLAALGQKHLLSANAKQQYDALWRTQFGPAQYKTLIPSSRVSAILAPLLPQGDPSLPFDLARFLKGTAASPTQDLATEFQLLQDYIASAGSSFGEPRAAESRVPVIDVQSSSIPNQVLNSTTASSFAGSATSDSTSSISSRIRNKREHSIIWSTVGVIVSLAVLFVVLQYVLTLGDKAPPPPASQSDLLAQTPSKGVEKASESPDRSMNSGLPRVPGVESQSHEVQPDTPVPPSTSDESGPASSSSNPNVGDAKGVANSRTDPAANDSAAANEMEDASGGDVGGLADVALSPEDLQAWQAELREIRSLLSNYNYATAQERLLIAKMHVQNKSQQQQLANLSVAAELASEAHAKLVEAVTALGPGESFQVGSSTIVVIVEADDKHIVVRLRGERKEYQFSQIPVGMVYALLDLKLPLQTPRSAALKATFALFQPNVRQRTLESAKELMATAIDGGVVEESIMAMFDEELP